MLSGGQRVLWHARGARIPKRLLTGSAAKKADAPLTVSQVDGVVRAVGVVVGVVGGAAAGAYSYVTDTRAVTAYNDKKSQGIINTADAPPKQPSRALNLGCGIVVGAIVGIMLPEVALCAALLG